MEAQRYVPCKALLPTLNLSQHEIAQLDTQCRELRDAILYALANVSYTDKQERIRELFKEHKELTLRQATKELDPSSIDKWRNFYYDRRGTLGYEDAFIVEHIHNQLLDVVSLLETFLNY